MAASLISQTKAPVALSLVRDVSVIAIQVISLGDRSSGLLRAKLREACRVSHGRVVVSFVGVADVAPGCLTALMEGSAMASTFGGRLVLANLPTSLVRVIDSAGLRSALPYAPTVDAAIHAVGRAKWTWLGPLPDVA